MKPPKKNLVLYPDDFGKEHFIKLVEQPPFHAITEIVRRAYEAAPDETGRLYSSGPERKRMTGHVRHSIIEEEFRKIGAAVAGITTEDVSYGTGSFVQATVGDAIVSQSCVTDEDSLPRQANFRNELRLLNLFEPGQDKAIIGVRRHLLVVHAPSPDNNAVMEFIYAAMPDANGSRYVYKYDLRNHPGASGIIPVTITPMLPTAGVQQAARKGRVSMKKKVKQENEE